MSEYKQVSGNIDEMEIEDVENYQSGGDKGFSHQTLVMLSMRKALENGSKEMKAGWFQNKSDKQGNMIRTYIEDTRLAFISSVECCLMAMACDLDEDANKEIKELFAKVEQTKKGLLAKEDAEWEELPPSIRRRMKEQGRGNIKGYFEKDKIWYQSFIEEQVKYYREVFKILTRLTKRLDFYKEEFFEA